MYLSADHWYRQGNLADVGFYSAGGVLFGVPDYVPSLMEYVKRYNAKLNFHHNLVAIDGRGKKAYFAKAVPHQPKETVEVPFDLIHVTPPQCAPDFIRVSPLAAAGGWVDVDQGTLRQKAYANVWSLGDVCSAPNAKTAAAARSFPRFMLDGKKPTRRAWWLKERILPPVYWHAMLKGKEWLAEPKAQ